MLRTIQPRKAASICLRLLRVYAAEVGDPLQHIYNLSLHLGKVPTLWKMTHVVPVLKKGHPTEPKDYSPVALTSHVMKARADTAPNKTSGAARPGPPTVCISREDTGCSIFAALPHAEVFQ